MKKKKSVKPSETTTLSLENATVTIENITIKITGSSPKEEKSSNLKKRTGKKNVIF